VVDPVDIFRHAAGSTTTRTSQPESNVDCLL